MYKHMRGIPTVHYALQPDIQNDARCVAFGERHCASGVCPRHRPVAYAECMARHATDSI